MLYGVSSVRIQIVDQHYVLVFILFLRYERDSFCNIEEEEPHNISTGNLAAISKTELDFSVGI